MTTLVIAYHSGHGHTEVLARKVAQGIESAGTKVLLHNVAELTDQLWADVKAADGIIFGSPTYMAGPSAPFKAFADASSKPWFTQDWKDKIAAGFTNSMGMNGDKVATLQYFSHLAAQHSMVWVSQGLMVGSKDENGNPLNRLSSWLGAMSLSENAPVSETNPNAADQANAVAFGKRVAEATQRWARGAE